MLGNLTPDDAPSAEPDRAPAVDPELKAIVADFESIGDNCELGLYQRTFGLEPISLLRFSSAFLPHLLFGLETDFEGVGDLQNTNIRQFPDMSWELFIELNDPEQNYSFRYHTEIHINPAERTPEYDATLTRKQSAHARFLVRRLRETMETGDKLLTFQQNGPIADADIERLHRAVRAHGPSTLLLVLPADEAHPMGLVTAPTAGLLLGYIDRFAARSNVGDFSVPGWSAVCRNAHALWQRQLRQPEPTAEPPEPDLPLVAQAEPAVPANDLDWLLHAPSAPPPVMPPRGMLARLFGRR